MANMLGISRGGVGWWRRCFVGGRGGRVEGQMFLTKKILVLVAVIDIFLFTDLMVKELVVT